MTDRLSQRIAKHVQEQQRRRVAATVAYLQSVAGEAEAEMKDLAPWEDQTGLARAGLSVTPQIDRRGREMTISLVFAHGMEYGIWLELANAGNFAIVGPTVDYWRPKIHQGLGRLWR